MEVFIDFVIVNVHFLVRMNVCVVYIHVYVLCVC